MGEVALSLKQFINSAAWGIRPFSFAERLMKGPFHQTQTLPGNASKEEGHVDF